MNSDPRDDNTSYLDEGSYEAVYAENITFGSGSVAGPGDTGPESFDDAQPTPSRGGWSVQIGSMHADRVGVGDNCRVGDDNVAEA